MGLGFYQMAKTKYGLKCVSKIEQRNIFELFTDFKVHILIQVAELFVDLLAYRAILTGFVLGIPKRYIVKRHFKNVVERHIGSIPQQARAAVFSLLAFHNVVLFEVGNFLAYQNRIHVETRRDKFGR